MNKIFEKIKLIGTIIKSIWDKQSKVIKVAGYMFLASFLYQLFQDFQISSLVTWIPEVYRIIVINFLTVVVVETVSYFKNLGNKQN